MKKNNKNLFISLLSLSVLGAIMLFVLNIVNKNNNKNENSDNSNNTNSFVDLKNNNSSETITDNNSINKILSVDPNKCRGCGRCAFIDSEHFKMSGGVSKVISQKNLESDNLKDAINSCPASAINLS